MKKYRIAPDVYFMKRVVDLFRQNTDGGDVLTGDIIQALNWMEREWKLKPTVEIYSMLISAFRDKVHLQFMINFA